MTNHNKVRFHLATNHSIVKFHQVTNHNKVQIHLVTNHNKVQFHLVTNHIKVQFHLATNHNKVQLIYLLDNIRVMVIVWRLRGNIIRTALSWIVWHNVHSQKHAYMSSSYRSNRLGLSHWDPYAVRRGSCLELYYCSMVLWFCWWA